MMRSEVTNDKSDKYDVLLNPKIFSCKSPTNLVLGADAINQQLRIDFARYFYSNHLALSLVSAVLSH